MATCKTGKICHKTKEGACIARKKNSVKYHQNVYKCAKCGFWHNGKSYLGRAERIWDLLDQLSAARATV
jgi:hypothetical protein